jgi:hypothetical protein
MFGEARQLGPLETRKRLLIAESELNRARLSGEWQTMADGVGDLALWAKTIGAWASAAALLGAGLLAGRSVRPAPRVARRSWFQKILTGARLASTIWFAVRAVGQKK